MIDPTITPLPIPTTPSDAPALVVLFGGTFDPPHKGHVELPIRVRDELEQRAGCLGGAWLVYVPAARSPHKDRAPAASDQDRINMLRLALAGHARTAVWTDEIDRAADAQGKTEPSFTLDTLRRAREWLDAHVGGSTAPEGAGGEVPGAVLAPIPLRLLIGADQAIGFHRWREPREIIRIAPPIVMVRGEVADADALVQRLRGARYWKRDDLDAWRGAMVVVGRIDVSATRVRHALRTGDLAEGSRFLAPAVLGYIREHGLYRG